MKPNNAPLAPDAKKRDFAFDNIRAALIFLVVFCHICELHQGDLISRIYLIVYTFHIPCLFFVSGYYARFDAKKVVRHLFLPYFVFQQLYRIFDCLVMTPGKHFVFQFTYPYWHMWYMLALGLCFLLIPLLGAGKSRRSAIGVLVFLTALAMYAGTDQEVGHLYAMSRTFVFLPCFFAGYFSGTIIAPRLVEGIRKRRWILLAVCALLLLGFYFWALRSDFPYRLLFGSQPYEKTGGNMWLRLLALAAAMVWMTALICVSPNRRIPLITAIGQRTMPIYLLHAFVQRLLMKYGFFSNPYAQKRNLLYTLLLTCAILLVFSLKPIDKLFRKIF